MGARRDTEGVEAAEAEEDDDEGDPERRLPLDDDDAADPGRLVLDAPGASASAVEGFQRGVWGREEGVEAEEEEDPPEDVVRRIWEGSSSSAAWVRLQRKRAAPTNTSSGPDILLLFKVPARARDALAGGAADRQSPQTRTRVTIPLTTTSRVGLHLPQAERPQARQWCLLSRTPNEDEQHSQAAASFHKATGTGSMVRRGRGSTQIPEGAAQAEVEAE